MYDNWCFFVSGKNCKHRHIDWPHLDWRWHRVPVVLSYLVRDLHFHRNPGVEGGITVGISKGLKGEYGTPLPICIFLTIPGIRPGGNKGYGGNFSPTLGVNVGIRCVVGGRFDGGTEDGIGKVPGNA
nr:hypothetical protein Itr_chr10CG01510 [Ipomoea trifida]